MGDVLPFPNGVNNCYVDPCWPYGKTEWYQPYIPTDWAKIFGFVATAPTISTIIIDAKRRISEIETRLSETESLCAELERLKQMVAAAESK